MIVQARWNALLSSAVFIIVVALSCGPTRPDLCGNSTQIGNGMVAGLLYQPDGTTPAVNAYVFLRKKNTLVDVTGAPGALSKKSADTVMTDDNGRFSIDSIDTGLYIVEGTDGGNNFALIDSVFVQYFDSTLVLAPDTLKPAGAIKGAIALSEGGDQRKVFVLAFGLDRFATTETDGAFKFGRLAEGNYHLRIMSLLDDYCVFDTMSVPVTSADTIDIGVIELPFSGIPTIKNLTFLYDTLQQQVTLYWAKPKTELVKSFNVYRRNIDPVTAIFTQLNFFPITDTVFLDTRCEQDRTYEYRVTAVDSNANEGMKSAGANVRIAVYDITPQQVTVAYDTLKQTIAVHWSNPDPSLVTGYNVYRRNIDLNETFWTPFNNRPIQDTSFIDSTFTMCLNPDSVDDDSIDTKGPIYEYCVGALIKNIREGAKSEGISIRISLNYVTPANVHCTYDTVKQTVRLQWSVPDTTLIRGFAVFRRNIDLGETAPTQLPGAPLTDTLSIDSTGMQNQTYEYRIASILKNGRATVTSTGVKVLIAASFTADTVLSNPGNGPGQARFINDIAVSGSGDIYLADQGNGRVLVYDSTMRYKRRIGGDVLRYPLKVGVDDRGNAFVANYDMDRDYSSIYIFDSSGATIDTILDSTVLNDLDVKDGLLYAITEGRFVSMYSADGNKIRSWHMSGQDGRWIAAGGMSGIFVSTGSILPDKNKVIVFDSLGSTISSITLPYYPNAIAFNDKKQWLYVVCYNGVHGSMLHVVDKNHEEVASYKINSDDQNISIGLQNNGAVLLVLKGEGKVYRLKPLVR